MAEKWKLGDYTFAINPNKYSESYDVIGDTVVTLDGTVISQPTTMTERYSLESVFFQYRERISAEVSIGSANFIDYVSGNIHTFNKSTKKITKYSSSLVQQSQITTTTSNEIAFDFDGTNYWVVENGAPCVAKKLNTSGVLVSSIPLDSVVPKALSVSNGHLWVTTNSSKLHKIDMSGNTVAFSQLPVIPFSETGYVGIAECNGYLAVAYNYDDFIGAYHIDMTNGTVVNQLSLPSSVESQDITYDGTNFIFLGSDNILRYTKGNTLMLDIYQLEKEIKSKGFINMVDDMEVSKRVYVEDYQISRLEGNIHKYSVSITASRVDRGVN
jgi:hypothetical protein